VALGGGVRRGGDTDKHEVTVRWSAGALSKRRAVVSLLNLTGFYPERDSNRGSKGAVRTRSGASKLLEDPDGPGRGRGRRRGCVRPRGQSRGRAEGWVKGEPYRPPSRRDENGDGTAHSAQPSTIAIIGTV
jgi:hypothetical protein